MFLSQICVSAWCEEFWPKHFTSKHFTFQCCLFVTHLMCKGFKGQMNLYFLCSLTLLKSWIKSTLNTILYLCLCYFYYFKITRLWKTKKLNGLFPPSLFHLKKAPHFVSSSRGKVDLLRQTLSAEDTQPQFDLNLITGLEGVFSNILLIGFYHLLMFNALKLWKLLSESRIIEENLKSFWQWLVRFLHHHKG